MLTNTHDLPADSESLREIDARQNGDGGSTSELLPWMFQFNDRVIVNKDSSLFAGFAYRGPDTDSIAGARLVSLIQQLVLALRQLSRHPATLWWTVHRRRVSDYPTLSMPDRYAQVVDDERRHAFSTRANFVNHHTLSVALFANAGLDRFVGRFGHALRHDSQSVPAALAFAARGLFSDQMSFAYTARELVAAVERFEEMLGALISGLPGLSFQRLAGAQLGGFLHRCCSPASRQTGDVALRDFLDDTLCDTRVTPGDDFLYFSSNGNRQLAMATGIPSGHDFWPDHVAPSTLDDLLKVPGEITISQVYRLAPRGVTERFVEGMRRYHDNRALNLRGLVSKALNKNDPNHVVRENRARTDAADEAQAIYEQVSRGRETYGWYNLTVLAHSPIYTSEAAMPAAYEQLVQTQKAVEDVFNGAHFTPVREEEHALSAFSITIPGMWREAARWSFIDSQVLARLAPLRTVSRGEEMNAHLSKEMGTPIPALAALPTDYGTPYWFTGFYEDLGHALLSGETGMGKTTLVNLVWTLLRKVPGADAFLFDRDNSSRIPVLLQGGQYFDPTQATQTEARLNPLSLLADARHFEWLMNWVESLASLRGYAPTTDDRNDLEKKLLATRSIDRTHWRLHALFVSLNAGRFKDELGPWVGEASEAHYFDNVQDVFDQVGGLVGFETGALMQRPKVAAPFMAYAFYRIRDRIELKKGSGRISPTFIGLPEVWHLMDIPFFATEIAKWLATMRKLLGMVWMDAQSPERYIASSIYPTIRDTVPTRIILPYPAMTESLRAALRELGLNDGQMQMISQGVPKRDYFITNKDGFMRRISLSLDKRTLAVLRSELSAQAVFNRHLASGRDDWREHYFEEMTRD